MKEKLTWGLVVAVSMVLGAAGVVGVDSLKKDNPVPAATAVVQQVPTPESTGRVSTPVVSGVSLSSGSVADLVAAVRPSVVRIERQRSGRVRRRRRVRHHAGHRGPHPDQQPRRGPGQHLTVMLHDGTTGSARLIGRDIGNDLAVIKADIPAEKLSPANAGRLRPGPRRGTSHRGRQPIYDRGYGHGRHRQRPWPVLAGHRRPADASADPVRRRD